MNKSLLSVTKEKAKPKLYVKDSKTTICVYKKDGTTWADSIAAEFFIDELALDSEYQIYIVGPLSMMLSVNYENIEQVSSSFGTKYYRIIDTNKDAEISVTEVSIGGGGVVDIV